ncbi:PIG-L family deacetylase [Lacihabitans lacunae]|uniref:PIG-L family deacetylase n=1 Tax=Lacihabitans lacunae TaxID=1028214 RepID=A0ABV7Z4Q6_9BACT
MKKNWLFILLFYCTVSVSAQTRPLTSSEILHGIEKLNTVGNAMYVAAHPDDENTLLIAWLAKEKKARTAYFAMTRGDGGQNLIGSEQGEYVGLVRTHELLEARKIDGGEQLFSRAIDFGFTKKTDEALLTWGREQILSDLVFQIRRLKPDVIINRFPPDERAGHGHHSASAVLSAEAFDAAADPTKFPEQLKLVSVWQAKRLVWNSYNRGFTNSTPEEKNFVKVSLGDFNPLLGKSYPEIAAEARSKHRSQGFGSAPTRNERYDFMVHIKGEPAVDDVFDGLDRTWNRIAGGKSIGEKLNGIIAKYDLKDPSKSVKELLEIYKLIDGLEKTVYTENKLEECKNLIAQCSGLYFEANPSVNFAAPGQSLKIFGTVTTRSMLDIKFSGISVSGETNKDSIISPITLPFNKSTDLVFDITIPQNAAVTQPYWLQKEAQKGTYVLSDEKFRSQPMAPDALQATFFFEIEGVKIPFTSAIKYKYTEPARGEIYKYFEIRPEIMVNVDQKVLVFADNLPKKVGISAKATVANLDATISLDLPKNWISSPNEIKVNFEEKNQEKQVYFTVTPPATKSEIEIKVVAKTSHGVYTHGLKTISYEHIPELNTFPEAKAVANKLDIKKKGQNLGYVEGAGDEVPSALRQIGYTVSMITAGNINENLAKYDAIIIGVRAYNTQDWLAANQELLLNYVKNGGNLIVQYQTQAFYGTVKTKDLGPYPLSVGRGRVTDENAAVTFLQKDHPILNTPNKITQKDFEGWIQERGLYFGDKYSDKYTPILAMNDEGEEPLEGSLLVAKYGKGNYVFTGLSLFRQLPAGVPGAYRLMSNLISLGK